VTRKDYVLVAEALRVSREIALAGPGFAHKPNLDEARGIEDAAAAIANRMLGQNPAFDRAHFLAVVRGEKELTSKPKPRNLALEIASGLNNQTRRD